MLKKIKKFLLGVVIALIANIVADLIWADVMSGVTPEEIAMFGEDIIEQTEEMLHIITLCIGFIIGFADPLEVLDFRPGSMWEYESDLRSILNGDILDDINNNEENEEIAVIHKIEKEIGDNWDFDDID